MNCNHQTKSYLLACDFCRKFFRKMKHLKRHVKIFHSEKSSKTIVDHNLDKEMTQTNKFREETIANRNKNSSKPSLVKECKKSIIHKTSRKNRFSSFVSGDKIIAKYRKLMSRIALKLKLPNVMKNSVCVNSQEMKMKRCDVLVRKMKIKPVSVKPCQVKENEQFQKKTLGLLFNSCDLCEQKFSTEEHLKLHKQFCKDIYIIKFKCKDHLFTSELCSSLNFQLL